MKIDELIAKIRQDKPAALGKVPDAAAGRLIRAAFAAIRESVDACEEGRVDIGGLGAFIARKSEPGEDGASKRTVRFRALKPAAAGAGTTEGGEATKKAGKAK